MEIITKNKHYITGRGTVYTLSLEENGFSRDVTKMPKFYNTEVVIEGEKYLVRGVECFGTFAGEVADTIGLVVRKL